MLADAQYTNIRVVPVFEVGEYPITAGLNCMAEEV